MDVAQILGTEFGYLDNDAKSQPPAIPKSWPGKPRNTSNRAAPLITGKLHSNQTSFLLLPASPAGRALGTGYARSSANCARSACPASLT